MNNLDVICGECGRRNGLHRAVSGVCPNHSVGYFRPATDDELIELRAQAAPASDVLLAELMDALDEDGELRVSQFQVVNGELWSKCGEWATGKTRTVSAGPSDAVVEAARDALEFYANPETYFAISFMGDSPCGDFIWDYSKTELGMKPGKLARATLAALAAAQPSAQEK